jgi:hypothetical protein
VSPAILLPASFAILLAGALLFTNGIEWFGNKVGLGQGRWGACWRQSLPPCRSR